MPTALLLAHLDSRTLRHLCNSDELHHKDWKTRHFIYFSFLFGAAAVLIFVFSQLLNNISIVLREF